MNPIRLGKILVIVGATLIVGTIGVFVFFFYAQDISTNVNEWGAFGSYLGGVLGVVISTLALIGAVIAIYQQHQTDQRVNNHTIASGLMRTIERLEDGIDCSLKNHTIRVHYADGKTLRETDAFRMLTGFGIDTPEDIAYVIPKCGDDIAAVIKNIMDEKLSAQERREKLNLYEIFLKAGSELRFMRDLLVRHKGLTGYNFTAIYYKRKYKRAVERLRQAGYPLETWDDINEM
jgi:hypothetical protein